MTAKGNSLLEVKDLVVEYNIEVGNNVRAVDHVTFELRKGEVLGLVGESGCGKSTLGFSLLGLLKGGDVKQGKVILDGEDITNLSNREMEHIRGNKVSMIFQASQNVLIPTQKVIDHFTDTFKAHGLWNNNKFEQIYDLVDRLEISRNRLMEYPFQFSGGMQQRIVIALSVLLEPQLLIADEPTTALDVLVQARILQLLKNLKEELDLTMILISHDLGVVAENATRVAIMYGGQLVEIGSSKSIFKDPKHPYTEALIRAIPDVKDMEKKKQESIPGSPPDLKNLPEGCRFAERCRYAKDVCRDNEVELIDLRDNGTLERQVRCLKYDVIHKDKFD